MIFTPSSFFFMLLFIITCTDVYSFVLCSSLLNYFLSHFVPAFYSTIGSWCIPALPMLLLPCNNTGLWLSPSYCLVWIICLLIIYCTLFPFPSSHFAHVSVLLCLAITPIKFCLSQSVSLQSCTITFSSTPNTCLNPAGWHHTTETLHRPHSSLNELCIGTTGFLLDSWTLRMGRVGYPKMLIRNYQVSRVNP